MHKACYPHLTHSWPEAGVEHEPYLVNGVLCTAIKNQGKRNDSFIWTNVPPHCQIKMTRYHHSMYTTTFLRRKNLPPQHTHIQRLQKIQNIYCGYVWIIEFCAGFFSLHFEFFYFSKFLHLACTVFKFPQKIPLKRGKFVRQG